MEMMPMIHSHSSDNYQFYNCPKSTCVKYEKQPRSYDRVYSTMDSADSTCIAIHRGVKIPIMIRQFSYAPHFMYYSADRLGLQNKKKADSSHREITFRYAQGTFPFRLDR